MNYLAERDSESRALRMRGVESALLLLRSAAENAIAADVAHECCLTELPSGLSSFVFGTPSTAIELHREARALDAQSCYEYGRVGAGYHAFLNHFERRRISTTSIREDVARIASGSSVNNRAFTVGYVFGRIEFEVLLNSDRL